MVACLRSDTLPAAGADPGCFFSLPLPNHGVAHPEAVSPIVASPASTRAIVRCQYFMTHALGDFPVRAGNCAEPDIHNERIMVNRTTVSTYLCGEPCARSLPSE